MEKKLLARYALGNPRRLWRQDRFVLSTFSPGSTDFKTDDPDGAEKMRRAVKTCADAGFNLLELGWARPEASDAAVRMCQQLGIGVIYQNLTRYGGMGTNAFCETSDLPGVMDEYRRWSSVAGYYIWDEPTHEEQMREARRLMDVCQREKPDTLPFVVALPSYNLYYTWKNGLYPKYLEDYAAIIDPVVLSFDYYPVGMKEHDLERQLDQSLIWCDLGIAQQTARAHDMPLWFYYQGQNLHNVETFIFPMVRLMMNAGVLYGAKGLQHYTAWESVVAADGGRGQFFNDQKDIHARFRELGDTLMALEFRRVIHDESLLPDCPYIAGLAASMDESELLCGKLPRRISVSEHEDAYGNKYLMVLNRDYLRDADIMLELKRDFRVYQVSPADGRQHVFSDCAERLETRLIPGELRLFRLQPADEEAYTIEYYLDK